MTVSVFRMTVLAVVSGAVAGGITASAVDALARPAVLGLEGEAWPVSAGAFMGEMVPRHRRADRRYGDHRYVGNLAV